MARFSISGAGDGGESSDRRSLKRQRLRSIVEDEEVDAELTGNSNAGGSREDDDTRDDTDSDHRGEDEDDDSYCEEAMSESRSVNRGDSSLTVTFTDPDALDCAVCCEPLKIPIFQCDNGHIACAPCCIKLRHKCPSCSMPIGYLRCRAMERVIEAIKVPCPNAKYGCTENVSYGERSAHENECVFIPCSCPARDCNFTGSYKHLSTHFRAEHRDHVSKITCDRSKCFCLSINNEMRVFQEVKEGELIVVQTFKVPYGVCVSVSAISPLARGVGEFSFNLLSLGAETLTLHSQMKRIQRVSVVDPPDESFMLIPSYLSADRTGLMMNLCITRKTYLD